jgi:hypothetical protein
VIPVDATIGEASPASTRCSHPGCGGRAHPTARPCDTQRRASRPRDDAPCQGRKQPVHREMPSEPRSLVGLRGRFGHAEARPDGHRARLSRIRPASSGPNCSTAARRAPQGCCARSSYCRNWVTAQRIWPRPRRAAALVLRGRSRHQPARPRARDAVHPRGDSARSRAGSTLRDHERLSACPGRR